MVMASKNSCTPPGTPVEVTLARRKNASAMTTTAAMLVPMIVSRLKVRPSQCTSSWCPTWIAPSARTDSVIGVSSILRFRVDDFQSFGADLLHHGQAGAEHQQCLEDRETEEHCDAAVCLEEERDGHGDDGDDEQPRRRVDGHLLLERMVLGGDCLDGAADQECVEQTKDQADAEEDTEEDVAGVAGGQYGNAGQGDADGKQADGP